MKFEIKTKPTKLSRENINIWVERNCKKDRKIFGGNLEDSREEYFGKRNKEGKMDGMGIYNFAIDIDAVDAKERGQYYGEFMNGKIEGEGVLIGADYTYVGQLKDSLKDGYGTFYLNDGLYNLMILLEIKYLHQLNSLIINQKILIKFDITIVENFQIISDILYNLKLEDNVKKGWEKVN